MESQSKLVSFLFSSLAVGMLVMGCRGGAGTAEPLATTRVCATDGGKRDVVTRLDGGQAMPETGSEVGRDSAQGDLGSTGSLDAAVDRPADNTVDSSVSPDVRLGPSDVYDGGTDTGAGGTGGSTGTGGVGGGGSSGTGGSLSIDAATLDSRDAPVADAPVDVVDAVRAEAAVDRVNDVSPDTADSATASLDADASPASDTPLSTPDSAADTPPAPSPWVRAINSKSIEMKGGTVDQAGNIFITAVLNNTGTPPTRTIDVGNGVTLDNVGYGADVLMGRLNPTDGTFANGTGSSTWIKALGDDMDQSGLGIAASQSHLASIGNYIGDLGITGLPSNASPLQYDFVLGINPTSGAAVWSKKIDMGGLVGLNSIYSNPTLDHYYVCGAATIAVADLNSPATPPAYPNLAFGGTAGDKTKDIVVAKISAADGSVLWARQIGGAGTQVCTGVTADASHVYLTGTYQGSLDFACGSPSTCAFPNVATISRGLLWVAKLNASDGSSLAAKKWGLSGSQSIRTIALDPQSNVLVGGALTAAIDFGAPVGSLTNSGTDAFVLKLDSSLNPLWAHNWGDESVQGIRGIASDSAGNVFAVGSFTGTLTGAGSTPPTSAGNDILYMQLDSSGAVQKVHGVGGPGSEYADWLSVGRFVTGSLKDRVVFGGPFSGSVTFGNAGSAQTPSDSVSYGYVVASPY